MFTESSGLWGIFAAADLSRHDAVVDLAEKKGISLLPILTYDVAWASPAHRHLDAWGEYVRKTVSRYQRKLRAWEIFNEPNIHMIIGVRNTTKNGLTAWNISAPLICVNPKSMLITLRST